MLGAALGVAGCLVGTLELTGFACDTGSHPCASSYNCVIPAGSTVGTCVPEVSSGATGSTTGAGGTSGGSSSGSSGGSTGGGPCSGAPACSAGGGLLLCDGGIQPCGDNLTCDYGKCVTECAQGQTCAAGAICDTSVNACVPTNACTPTGGGCFVGGVTGLCLAGVCTQPPPVGGSTDCAPSPDDAGMGMVVVGGVVATFPLDDATPLGSGGGTVTFFSPAADGGLLQVESSITTGVPQIPSYSVTLPVGTWTALVQQPGVLMPTYFPGLEVLPAAGGSAVLNLESAVELDYLPLISGVTPQAGHILWVGRGASCDGQGTFLGGYTVGLSPAPPDLSYLALVPPDGGHVEIVPGLTASSSSWADFIAEDAPYATTQFTLAFNSGAGTTVLMSGTFVPPPYMAGQTIAVALTYPSFTQ